MWPTDIWLTGEGMRRENRQRDDYASINTALLMVGLDGSKSFDQKPCGRQIFGRQMKARGEKIGRERPSFYQYSPVIGKSSWV
jgi:hypothetical protein